MLLPGLHKLLIRKTDNTCIQLLRYAFVGGLAFAVDFGSLFVLTEYLGLYYLHSAALAFIFGLTTNYLLSVLWVFQQRTFQNRLMEYAIFALLGVLGLGLNQGLMYFLTEHIRLHYLFSKVVATGVVFLWNFGSRKLILFHHAQGSSMHPGQEQLYRSANAIGDAPTASMVARSSLIAESLDTNT